MKEEPTITVREYRQLVIDYLRDTACAYRNWGFPKDADTMDSAATLVNALPATREEAAKYRARAETRWPYKAKDANRAREILRWIAVVGMILAICFVRLLVYAKTGE